MALPAGAQLGSHEVIRPLGAGGMGDVYLAFDAALNRRVAIKVLHSAIATAPHRLARLQQEARAASALSHPNICHIYQLGETPAGEHYIAMEYVEGETLAQRLLGGRLALSDALDIAIQVAGALVAAHAAGIVHRDIKPANVIVRPDRLVKVLDFGLAKLVPRSTAIPADGHTLTAEGTSPGSLLGTIDYMSPEQARGQEVDARTDVWSFGVVLYEMIAGRAPFSRPTRSDVLVAILEHEPALLADVRPQLPAELQRIVTKTLRKHPDRRYQATKDLLLDLEVLRDELQSSERHRLVSRSSGAPSSRPVDHPPARRSWLPSRIRSRPLASAAAAILLVSAISAAWWVWQSTRSRREGSAAEAHGHGNYPLTRLTSGPGLQTDPTFSPDGKFIAYASDRAGNFDIWVQALAEGSEPVQVTKSPAHDTQPAWSPDGARLVFRSEQGGRGGLSIVPAFGGAAQRLTSFGSHPAWSADGTEILFFGEFPAVDEWVWPGGPMSLHVAALDGEPPREILDEFLTAGSWRWVTSHPDGRISALGVHRTRQFGFYTVPRSGDHVTTSKTIPLGTDPGAQPVRFRWNAAGTMLYIEAVSNKTRSVWQVTVHPATLDWMSAERLTTPAPLDTAVTVSHDGTRVAFSRQQEKSRIWLYGLDTSEERPRLVGAGRPLTEDDAFGANPALSPDGRKLAYQLWHHGTDRSDLWVVDIDGGSRELLATDVKGHAWSRDGTKVLYGYARLDRQPWEFAAAYRPLGGPEQVLTSWSSAFFFSPMDWMSGDGALLGVYASPPGPEGPTSIVLWPASKPKAVQPERVLLSSPEGTWVWNPKFAPNGRWIHFTWARLTQQAAELQLCVAPAAATTPAAWVRIAPDHHWPDKPEWSADGKALFFVSSQGALYNNLWATRFDPDRGRPIGKPFALTHFDSPTMVISPSIYTSDLSISPTHAALTMLSTTGSIWMLENVGR